MIKETDGDRFEEMRSLNQELTFEAAQKEFELRDIEFGSQQMQTLKMIDNESIYPLTARRLRLLRWEMNCVCYLLDSAS